MHYDGMRMHDARLPDSDGSVRTLHKLDQIQNGVCNYHAGQIYMYVYQYRVSLPVAHSDCSPAHLAWRATNVYMLMRLR